MANNCKDKLLLEGLRWIAAHGIDVVTKDMAKAAADRIEELQRELEDERYRHDRYADFCVAQGEELEKLKNKDLPKAEFFGHKRVDSPDLTITIPREALRAAGIGYGHKVCVVVTENCVSLVKHNEKCLMAVRSTRGPISGR